ncbi:MAG: HPF/RaiA family ribosome-associated protein [Nitrospiraceae bacterium]|nr:MAG: HPF/RaiA family ribosome-associated protein [Nitrospiraceae bacterium]
MEIPLQITNRSIKLSNALESEIRKRAEKLDKFYSRITRCKVVVESPHRHSHQGKRYNVQIVMTVPGAELVVKRNPHEDLYVAIRDSFNAARRQLEDYSKRQRGDVKQHEETPVAVISALFSDKGYGFITTSDNHDIYFHRNSVLNSDFDHLEPGMKVRYTEGEGEKGPQATTVTVL